MGTDIHAFIEIDYFEEAEPFSNEDSIRPFNEGELFWWRSYDLYNALGDGRNYHFDESRIEKHCLIPPRGLPAQMGSAVINRFFHVVDDHGYFQDLHPDLRTVSSKCADEWLAAGLSFPGPPLKIERLKRGPEELRRVSHPDWHSPSWLTLPEIYDSLRHFGFDPASSSRRSWEGSAESLSIEVVVSLQAMQSLEDCLGEGRTRLVFWFDN